MNYKHAREKHALIFIPANTYHSENETLIFNTDEIDIISVLPVLIPISVFIVADEF